MARKTPVEVYRQPLAMQGTPDDAHLAAPCSSTPINKMPLTRLIKQSTIMTLKVFLLQGVTGSGKTEVYLQSIANALQQGKDSINACT